MFFCLQVDKHIRRLDTDLARFEADLKEKQIESTDYDSTSSKGKKGVCKWCLEFIILHIAETKKLILQIQVLVWFQVILDRKKRRWQKRGPKWRVQMKMGVPRVHRRKSNSFSRMFLLIYFLSCVVLFFFFHSHNTFPVIIRGEFNSPSSNFGNVHPSDVLDMPVDPNEPTYCLCHQVSYGEMIGCDNTDVSFMTLPLLWPYKKNTLIILILVINSYFSILIQLNTLILVLIYKVF